MVDTVVRDQFGNVIPWKQLPVLNMQGSAPVESTKRDRFGVSLDTNPVGLGPDWGALGGLIAEMPSHTAIATQDRLSTLPLPPASYGEMRPISPALAAISGIDNNAPLLPRRDPRGYQTVPFSGPGPNTKGDPWVGKDGISLRGVSPARSIPGMALGSIPGSTTKLPAAAIAQSVFAPTGIAAVANTKPIAPTLNQIVYGQSHDFGPGYRPY